MKRILFITWDGPQVAYLEGLFLPIFAALHEHGYQFSVLQFTWGSRAASDRAAAACATHGIPYRRVDVWRPGAARALMSALLGRRDVDRAVRDWKVDALMPRSLLPALATLLSASARKCPIVFDSDGLAADERVDFAGLDPKGLTYRLLRRIEARSVRRAEVVLVRAEAAIAILRERSGDPDPGKFHVVTNGRNAAPFLAAVPVERSSPGPRLCYLGSVGPQYLPNKMLALAASIKRHWPEATLSLFTQDEAALAPYLAHRGLEGAEWILVRSLAPEEVPAALSQHDIGFALRTTKLSMLAVAPIKIGDYLLAGLPVIGNPQVGAIREMVEQGCLIADDAEPEQIRRWIEDVLQNRAAWRDRCRRLGIESFSLERSVDDYRHVLECLGK